MRKSNMAKTNPTVEQMKYFMVQKLGNVSLSILQKLFFFIPKHFQSAVKIRGDVIQW